MSAHSAEHASVVTRSIQEDVKYPYCSQCFNEGNVILKVGRIIIRY